MSARDPLRGEVMRVNMFLIASAASFLEDGKKKFSFGKRIGIIGTVLEIKGITGL